MQLLHQLVAARAQRLEQILARGLLRHRHTARREHRPGRLDGLLRCGEAGIDADLDQDLDDRPRRQAEIERGADMAAELGQALDGAEGGQRADHAVVEREAGPAPDGAIARFGVERPHDRRRAVVVAKKAPAHGLTLLA